MNTYSLYVGWLRLRFVCGRGCWTEDAQILSLRGHGEHCIENGNVWRRYVSQPVLYTKHNSTLHGIPCINEHYMVYTWQYATVRSIPGTSPLYNMVFQALLHVT